MVALAKNGRKVELHALAALELGLGRGAQPGDPGDVDLLHRGQLRGDLQRLGHPLGDHLAQPRHLHRGARLRAVGGRGRDGGRGARSGRPPGPRRPAAAAGSGSGSAAACSAAASTSCLRIRPPTPVPLTEARSTPCSAASLRTSGVTYGRPARAALRPSAGCAGAASACPLVVGRLGRRLWPAAAGSGSRLAFVGLLLGVRLGGGPRLRARPLPRLRLAGVGARRSAPGPAPESSPSRRRRRRSADSSPITASCAADVDGRRPRRR